MADDLESSKEIVPTADSIEDLSASDRKPEAADCFSDTEQPALGSTKSLLRNCDDTAVASSHTLIPTTSVIDEFHLPCLESAALQPLTKISLASREISSSSHCQKLVTAAQHIKQNDTFTGNVNISPANSQSPSSVSNGQMFLGEIGSNSVTDDGRTTSSAPPCTPAPELNHCLQSPYRNNRQIKKIDLLAMSQSRQSDGIDSARRDGRLAPSPRKKDEVLRNSGFTFPAWRGWRTHSSLRPTQQNNSQTGDSSLSPERLANSGVSSASPNVDVVSVDDQADLSRCTFSIQFHEFPAGEQMMKCNQCGFVTNNLNFYRRHRRQHNRQSQPDLIHCNLCTYSTSQIRKLRKHTVNHHHLPHCLTSSNLPSRLSESSQQPLLQGQVYMNTGSICHTVSGKPVHLPVEAAGAVDLPMKATASTTLPIGALLDLPKGNSQARLRQPLQGREMPGKRLANREHQVTDYMHSAISNFMPARHSNSVTSSSVALHATRNSPQETHPILPSGITIPLEKESYNYRFWNSDSSSESSLVKVKRETTAAHATLMPAYSPSRQSETLDSETGMDLSSDDHTSSSQADVDSRPDARMNPETIQAGNHLDGSAIGTQFPVPYIKIEFPPHGESCNYIGNSEFTRSDRGIQCEIISSSGQASREVIESVSSAGGSACPETRCHYCGITFNDEVLYSLHTGCHSHTDPFKCNVCGKQCHNKYNFYSHIMRGHQAKSNN